MNKIYSLHCSPYFINQPLCDALKTAFWVLRGLTVEAYIDALIHTDDSGVGKK